MIRTHHTFGSDMEQWWPVDDVAPSGGRREADHLEAGWWDPGDLPRTRLRLASALVDELLAMLPAHAVGPDTRLLELLCGPGASAQELALRTGVRPHLFEPRADRRPGLAVHARESTVDPATAVPLEAPDASFDVVWAPTCFARGPHDWAPLLAEAHRVLRPGGRLVAIHAGPGVWSWEREDPWDEEHTGLLLLDLDRPADRGGPVSYVSGWWLRDHWGRGFALEAHRPAGVAMTHPTQGYGISCWRRTDGPALSADDFAAETPGDRRAGAAWQRQVALAHDERRAARTRQATTIAGATARLTTLEDPAAVDDLPATRAALAELAALRAEVTELRESAWWRAGAPLRALHRSTNGGDA